MNRNRFLTLIASAGFVAGCATAAPKELVAAREAYRRASTGSAATVAPADVHLAKDALDRAEHSFKDKPDSYRTRDLAYVAERRAEIAEARASIANEQKRQARANEAYQATQTTMTAEAKQDLKDARSALASSELAGEKTAERLSAETKARVDAERLVDKTMVDLSAEQQARAASEQRAAAAQVALAKLAAVKEEPRGMVITLSGSVLFASNRAALLPEALKRLDEVAEVLLTTRERNLTIEGHTDSRGSDSQNLELSQLRADAVRNYLVRREYQPDRIVAHGLGESHPVADNATAEGRANNRRVEIVIEREPHASNP